LDIFLIHTCCLSCAKLASFVVGVGSVSEFACPSGMAGVAAAACATVPFV